MSFNKANTQQQNMMPIHYIIALDSSGSMLGDPWNNLKNSFAETIKRIAEKDALNTSRVSTIIFSDTAQI